MTGGDGKCVDEKHVLAMLHELLDLANKGKAAPGPATKEKMAREAIDLSAHLTIVLTGWAFDAIIENKIPIGITQADYRRYIIAEILRACQTGAGIIPPVLREALMDAINERGHGRVPALFTVQEPTKKEIKWACWASAVRQVALLRGHGYSAKGALEAVAEGYGITTTALRKWVERIDNKTKHPDILRGLLDDANALDKPAAEDSQDALQKKLEEKSLNELREEISREGAQYQQFLRESKF